MIVHTLQIITIEQVQSVLVDDDVEFKDEGRLDLNIYLEEDKDCNQSKLK